MRRRSVLASLTCVVMPLAAQVASEPQRSGIPFRQSPPGGLDSGRWMLGLGAALAAAAGALWWLRRRLPGALPGVGGRRMRVLEMLRISPRSVLLLVEVDGRTLLIGEQAGSIVLLPSPVEAPRE